jgi:quercetin dioxygenase-like cupin family protein
MYMQRKDFLRNSLLTLPATALGSAFTPKHSSAKKPFVVGNGQSRFGDSIRFLGVHPNDLKISGKDTGGQLSMFYYQGLGKVGPMLHVHFYQDEIFTVINGEYRFVVGKETHELSTGQTIFLPRGIPHTWIQLSDTGQLIYLLQPAGKMEEFFTLMNTLKVPPSAKEMNRIHQAHGMKVVGPPLQL